VPQGPINVAALAPQTLQRLVVPLQCMDRRLALFGVAEGVSMREHRYGCASPGGVKRILHWVGDSHLFMTFVHSYKLLEIERSPFSASHSPEFSGGEVLAHTDSLPK